MTEITEGHVKWAVVDRLRQMLEAPPSNDFGVTATYALFTATLCWVMQHLRIPEHQTTDGADQGARHLWTSMQQERAFDAPWDINLIAYRRIEPLVDTLVEIPSARGMGDHTVGRFFTNLRNAVAHGDARKVEPFNHQGTLLGYTFTCQERDRGTQQLTWEGAITLLQADMQRLGSELARRYCAAIQAGVGRYSKEAFEADARSITEKVA